MYKIINSHKSQEVGNITRVKENKIIFLTPKYELQ